PGPSFPAAPGPGCPGPALGALLLRDGVPHAADAAPVRPDGKPHFAPKAKSVIWIFLCGGVSHVESFDVKPELNKYAGKSIDATPYKDVFSDPRIKDVVAPNPAHGGRRVLIGLDTGHKKYGQSGRAVADRWEHVGSCADDPAVVRSLWTPDNDHGAQLQWHTGRHVREGAHPTIGSWAAYGLGTLNANLPTYAVLGVPTGDCCGGAWTHGAGYLGPEYAGVRLNVGAADPIPFVRRPASVTAEEQTANLSLFGKLNTLSGIDYPDDQALRARIKSYELAFGMQTAVPDVLNLKNESVKVRSTYGLENPVTRPFGELCLSARRLVEKGVRFVQVFHGGGGGGAWDAHSGIKRNHESLSAQVDLPVAGLLKDLKQPGMLNDTLVVWGTELGRSPGAQGDG